MSEAEAGWVLGVDGCPGGWLVVRHRIGEARTATVHLLAAFDEVMALEPRAAIIGVDMPIGLPEVAGKSGRLADGQARANLGARQSSVFAVPSRAAVMETDYRRACTVALATSDPPRMVSKQCFHLFAKIREIDALITPVLQRRIRECHPELGFWALNGRRPLDEPKKVKGRPHPAGLAMRIQLLAAAGYDPLVLADVASFRRSDVGPDDLLDAAACAATAARIACGAATRFPAEPTCDARGLRMEIWG